MSSAPIGWRAMGAGQGRKFNIFPLAKSDAIRELASRLTNHQAHRWPGGTRRHVQADAVSPLVVVVVAACTT